MDTTEKVIEAAKLMIRDYRGMQEIVQMNTEFYFKFRNHTFSILKSEEDYTFFIYPKWDLDTSSLAAEFEFNPSDEIKAVPFNSSITGEEGKAIFAKLYQAVESKDAGVDEILDDILDEFIF